MSETLSTINPLAVEAERDPRTVEVRWLETEFAQPRTYTAHPAQSDHKADLINMLDELRDEMATQQERFDNKDSVDKNDRISLELSTKIGELTQQLRSAEAELGTG
jgi:hypothetical protein